MSDRSAFNIGRHDGAGTTHTTPATLHASRPLPSLADSTTSPSNTCHYNSENNAETEENSLPLHKIVPHCIRQCSHTSLPESQLECAKARMYDPSSEVPCGQDCHLQHCCHLEDPSKAMENLGSLPSKSFNEDGQGIILKTLKPQRSYSLRVAKSAPSSTPVSSKLQDQDASFTNGPSKTHKRSLSIQRRHAEKKQNSCRNISSVAEVQEQSAKDIKTSSSHNLLSRRSSCAKQRTASDGSSNSDCSDVSSEMEDVIMTTAC